MKKIMLLATVLFSVIGCTTKSTIVTISLNNAEDSVVYVRRPVNDLYMSNTDTLTIGNKKSVSLTIPVDKISLMMVINGNNYAGLIVEKGKKYDMVFDYTKQPVVQVNDSAQMVLNRIFSDKNFYKYEFVDNFTKCPLDTVASKMMANFEELLSKDKAQFNSIEMSIDKRNFIEKHLELYWMGSLSKVIRANYYDTKEDNTAMYPGYMELWQTIYEKYPLSESMTPSYFLSKYFECSMIMKQAKSDKAPARPETAEEYFQQHTDLIYNNITDPKIKESVIANSIYYMCLNNSSYDKSIIKHIERLYAEYPNNANYKKAFDPFIKSVTEFNKRIEGDFPEYVKFVENGDNINTFKEVISKFKGKPLFVDFWFSSCSPCRAEFKYNDTLKQFLKDNGIEMLYISIDRKEEDWHNAIKFSDLEGNHIRTNKEFHQDIYKNYGVGSFPRYMLIDSEGTILIDDAKKPNEGKALFSQIKDALKL